ncbi:MAG: inositol monophosphatase [SAR324 cluster bacterium]|nr:inositol monophosphatase [SAR324 cluster bacterium]MEE1577424.1 inositol monophosphatase [Deltaproteobacteria bacterium]MDP6245826.1 inositol monophosphatase [SAR324 cluster bacterium]MDP6463493.1 inositol monophosphatase [SAR324 cluster bacterium]MDP6638160.1 inositol monophosphatase [SAR324 cluster bacterium]
MIAREAGLLALKYFRDPDHLKWESKGPQDWVSQADREVEKRIREYLLDLFPQDGFLGEESGKYQMDAPGIWVVDPIDGTSCFRRGMPEWCVSIAYVLSDRRIPLGVIYQPCTDELFSADPETGMRINGTQMEAAKIETFQDGVVGIGYSWKADPEKTLGVLQAIIDKQGNFESMGSGALMVAYVACGRYIGFYESFINSWDCLAAISMVRTAGGWTSDFLADNGLFEGNFLSACAPGLEPFMEEMLKKSN